MERTAPEIRRATTDDAASIAALTGRCYGTSYLQKEFLDAEFLTSRIRDESLAWIVADDPADGVVGQACLERLPNGRSALYNRVVVDVAHRGRGIMNAMGAELLDRLAPALGLDVAIGTPVTSHVFAQRNFRSLGMTPLGLLLGVYPRTTLAGIGEASAPMSVFPCARAIHLRGPRPLGLAGAPRERAESILSAFGLGVATAADGPPLGWSCRRAVPIGLLHAEIAPGADRPLSLDSIEGEAARIGPRLFWVDVPAARIEAADLVHELRGRGFGFAAFLPGAGHDGGDVYRLQRVAEPIDPDAIALLPELEPLRDEILAEVLEPAGAS